MRYPIMNSFEFDGRCSLEWGIGLSGSGVWDAPERKGELIEIPGMNGSAWVDEGVFRNITVPYPCWMADGFHDKIDDFRAYMMAHADKYYRLEDTYHPEEFRRARFMGPFTANPGRMNWTGKFNLDFDCDPRRFLKNGENEITFTASDSAIGVYMVYNPTYFNAHPVIRIKGIWGTAGPTVAINDFVIQFSNVTSDIEFDCDTMVARSNGVVVYGMVEADERPYLHPGENRIAYRDQSNPSESCNIVPRWWTV